VNAAGISQSFLVEHSCAVPISGRRVGLQLTNILVDDAVVVADRPDIVDR
jgi:hypothetical protein